MEIQVRKATTTDIEPMVALLGNLFSIEEDFEPDVQRQTKGLTMMLSGTEDRTVLAADLGEELVGMVSGQLLISTAQGGVVALIEDLVVAPKLRGTGVGANLLAAIESWGRALGATRFQLLAEKDNGPAKGFYEKAGWEVSNLNCLCKTKTGTKMCRGIKNRKEQ
jgi:GNAT superfamily N-acetyltransferase